jgi:glucans biosynthesis protein
MTGSQNIRMITHTPFAILMAVCLGGLASGNMAAAEADSAPVLERLIDEARASTSREYQEASPELPEFLKNLGYDGYMDISTPPEKSLWHGGSSRFQLQFFHPGYLYQKPVRIHVIEEGKESEVPFAREMFDYGENEFPEPVPDDLFLTGLRVLYPLHDPATLDEIAVFHGASYFRILGTGQHFGSSLRGLAMDTAESSGEEFPDFTRFWIEKPGPEADQIRILARLESRRVSGAYQFLINPGGTTVVEVEGNLFFRDEVKKVGLAPLTSMFLFGENRTRYFPDFRPEVHDADGLLLRRGNESWEWRPLTNPVKEPQITGFPSRSGFGLLQRDRRASSYEDLQAGYENRPSIWVEPGDDWGEGRVELVELPTTKEANDNIVAYWVPKQKIAPARQFHFRYKLYAYRTAPERPPTELWRTRSTRLQPGKDRTRFVIDFADGPAGERDELTAKVETPRGKIENVVTQRNPQIDGWRTFFDVIPEGEPPFEIRAWLVRGEQVRSETWIYHFNDR